MSTPAFAIGNITRSPQLSHTGDGTPVVNLSLAENTRRLIDGEWVDAASPPGPGQGSWQSRSHRSGQ